MYDGRAPAPVAKRIEHLPTDQRVGSWNLFGRTRLSLPNRRFGDWAASISWVRTGSVDYRRDHSMRAVGGWPVPNPPTVAVANRRPLTPDGCSCASPVAQVARRPWRCSVARVTAEAWEAWHGLRNRDWAPNLSRPGECAGGGS